jgi:phosphoglycolate phosphatase-like HAD superfamily hydrolase
MLTLLQLKGAIFDVDDTLLDNHPGGTAHGLHERSRLAAIRKAGRRHHIPELEHFSEQANLRVFLDAKVHSIEGAVWQAFLVTGLQTNPDLDPTNPLMQEIVALKNDLHEAVLREHGRPVPGAPEFIQALVQAGLGDITTRHSHASLETLAVAPDVTVDSYATLLSKLT